MRGRAKTQAMNSTTTGRNENARIRVEDRQPDWHQMSPEARTYWFISEMLSTLNGEPDYESAMNRMLEMMSMVIQTERLSIFECDGDNVKVTFELTEGDIRSLLGVTLPLPHQALVRWFDRIGDNPVALVPDTATIESFSPALYSWCRENGVGSFMATPFFSDGALVGFLGAYNYRIDESVDLNRLFKVISSFIGARIDNRRLINSLKWAGEHDPLTGLLNRRGVESILAKQYAENPDEPCVLILIDLDDFKRINDVFGHAAGDEALKSIARAMEQAFPGDALLCRNGGDEFLVALIGDAAHDFENPIERFEHMELGYEYDGKHHRMTASIGYAQYPEQSDTIRDLYAKADAALYTVKLTGKAGCGKFDDEAGAHYRSRLGFTARDIVENVPYRMFVHKADQECPILFASSKFMNLLNCENMYDLLHLSGGSLAGIIHPDDRDRVRQAYERHALSDEADTIRILDFRAIVKDGEPKDVRVISHLVNIKDVGQTFYTVVTGVNGNNLMNI